MDGFLLYDEEEPIGVRDGKATDRRRERHHLEPIDSESKGAFCPAEEVSASRAVREIFDDFDARPFP